MTRGAGFFSVLLNETPVKGSEMDERWVSIGLLELFEVFILSLVYLILVYSLPYSMDFWKKQTIISRFLRFSITILVYHT